jgi:hypothetical protein
MRERLLLPLVFILPCVALVAAANLYGAAKEKRVELRRTGVPATAVVGRAMWDHLEVKFTIDGRAYQANLFCGSQGQCSSHHDGDSIAIRYDASDPRRAVMQASPYSRRGEILSWVGLVVCPLGAVVAGMVLARRRRARPPEPDRRIWLKDWWLFVALGADVLLAAGIAASFSSRPRSFIPVGTFGLAVLTAGIVMLLSYRSKLRNLRAGGSDAAVES